MASASTSNKIPHQQPSPHSPFRTIALSVALALAAAALVLIFLFTSVFSIVRYFGSGMEPSLENGQILILRKTDKVEQGDVVAFYYNNKVLVRRVICDGGKSIFIDEDGAVSIGSEPLQEPYVESPSLGQCDISFPYNISLDHYFVMGDNRAVAMDSRLSEIGTVSQDRVLGKVLLVL